MWYYFRIWQTNYLREYLKQLRHLDVWIVTKFNFEWATKTTNGPQFLGYPQNESNSNSVIFRADKGNANVVLDVDDFNSKLIVVLHHGPISKIEREIKKMIKSSNILSVFWRNPIFSRIYDLPKIHKSLVPLKPIACLIGSPT